MAGLYDISQENGRWTVLLPGFDYTDGNHLGTLRMWGLAHLAEMGRAILFRKPMNDNPMMSVANLLKSGGYLSFLGATKYTISPQLYSSKIFYKTLKSTNGIVNIGQSSFTSRQTINLSDSGQLLAIVDVKIVIADFVTRRAAPIPDDVRQVLGKACTTSETNGLVINIPDEPNQTPYCCQYKVVWSDTDENRHTNQAQYMRFTLDAIAEASHNGHFERMPVDIEEAQLETIEVIYKGETRPGEILDIIIWQKSKLEIACLIKNRNTTVFKLQAKYRNKARL